MHATTVVNLKGPRDDPEYADVVYVGRAMNRGGWHLESSPLPCHAQVIAEFADAGPASPSATAATTGTD
jgi:hypothetical protein